MPKEKDKPPKDPKSPKGEKIEYILVDANTVDGLVTIVNQLIDEGWEPIGGPCCMRNAPRVGIFAGLYTRFLVQALIRPTTDTGKA